MNIKTIKQATGLVKQAANLSLETGLVFLVFGTTVCHDISLKGRSPSIGGVGPFFNCKGGGLV